MGGLERNRILPLVFERPPLDFPVPGMSDVMPYRSTRFSEMGPAQLDAYRNAWRRHVREAIDEVRPDLIHSHHIWILSWMVKGIAPGLPVVNQCHATGLRQMALCPHLAGEVRAGCARNDRFLVQHSRLREQVSQTLGVPQDRIDAIGAGYREDLFHARGRKAADGARILYVGKYSHAKGVGSLLDAFERLRRRMPDVELHVAGSGAGEEAQRLRERMVSLSPAVVLHGALDQPDLADLMRRCTLCVLPSFYEGMPLVLVEAFACGCRLVATRLPGIVDLLAPHLGASLDLVDPPRIVRADVPVEEDLPGFVDRLEAAIATALGKANGEDPARIETAALEPFTWGAVFERIESVWRALM